MSHHAEQFGPDVADLDLEPHERSWFARLVAPEGGSTPTTVAFLLGASGTAAFIGSLSLDWVNVTLASEPGTGRSEPPVDLAGSTLNVFILGLIYTAGVVALLGFLGTVINRPEAALRSRMGASGLGVGLAGVVIGSILRLPDELAQIGSSSTVQATVGYQAGAFCALAATILPTAAVWFAASPAARTLAVAETGPVRRVVEPGADPSGVPGPRPIFAPRGPLDLTVIPDDHRR